MRTTHRESRSKMQRDTKRAIEKMTKAKANASKKASKSSTSSQSGSAGKTAEVK
jgi:hypothetical protein